MKYRIILLTDSVSEKNLIAKYIATIGKDYQLFFYTYNAVDIFDIFENNYPEIIIIKDSIDFASVNGVISKMYRRSPVTQYILIRKSDYAGTIASEIEGLISSTISEESLNEEGGMLVLWQALEKAREEYDNLYITAKHQSFHISEMGYERVCEMTQENRDFVEAVHGRMMYSKRAFNDGTILILGKSIRGEECFELFDEDKYLNILELFENLREIYWERPGKLYLLDQKRIAIILFGCYDRSKTFNHNSICALCEKLNNSFPFLEIPMFKFAVSDSFKDSQGLVEAYKKVCCTERFFFFCRDERILTSRHVVKTDPKKNIKIYEDLIHRIFQNIDKYQMIEMLKTLDELFQKLAASYSFELVKIVFSRLVLECAPYLLRSSNSADDFFCLLFDHKEDWCLEDYYKEFKEILLNIFTGNYAIFEKSENKYIDLAMDYILLNVQGQIRLNDVAEAIHVNSVYLSRLFRKELNQTFTEVRNEIRIRYSAKLLESDMRISEIAEASGFENVKYFSRVFKKYFKISPTDYRMKISKIRMTGDKDESNHVE